MITLWHFSSVKQSCTNSLLVCEWWHYDLFHWLLTTLGCHCLIWVDNQDLAILSCVSNHLLCTVEETNKFSSSQTPAIIFSLHNQHQHWLYNDPTSNSHAFRSQGKHCTTRFHNMGYSFTSQWKFFSSWSMWWHSCKYLLKVSFPSQIKSPSRGCLLFICLTPQRNNTHNQ